MIQHQAANLTYRDALERFEGEPRIENLPRIHAVLIDLLRSQRHPEAKHKALPNYTE